MMRRSLSYHLSFLFVLLPLRSSSTFIIQLYFTIHPFLWLLVPRCVKVEEECRMRYHVEVAWTRDSDYIIRFGIRTYPLVVCIYNY
jgi:hypothetical protein